MTTERIADHPSVQRVRARFARRLLEATGHTVEFRGEDPEVPIKPEHKMTVKQVRRELEPQGFVFKESLEFLPEDADEPSLLERIAALHASVAEVRSAIAARLAGSDTRGL